MMGVLNVDAMLRGMTAKQFLGWETFLEVEPTGEARADLRAASVVQILANAHRDTEAHKAPFTLRDCVGSFNEAVDQLMNPKAARRQTVEEQMAVLRVLALQQAMVEQQKRGR